MYRVVTQGWVIAIMAVTAIGLNRSAAAQFGSQKVGAPDATVEQIRELQRDKTKQDKFVLVDVRSDEECRVSVIKGAITKAQFEREFEKHKQKAVIVYCTVGARSATYANQLKQKGWNAWNYKGSIIDWCKNKLPLTTVDGKATNRVHTYSRWYRVPSIYKAVY